ncbi:hypothetical protein [Streptomyces sp. NPDC055400]
MLKPRSTATRELVNLDGLWKFATAAGAGDQPWTGPLGTPLEAPVPASYNDLFTDSAIRDHVGWVWYQRTVRVPRGWADERVILRVEAATHQGFGGRGPDTGERGKRSRPQERGHRRVVVRADGDVTERGGGCGHGGDERTGAAGHGGAHAEQGDRSQPQELGQFVG